MKLQVLLCYELFYPALTGNSKEINVRRIIYQYYYIFVEIPGGSGINLHSQSSDDKNFFISPMVTHKCYDKSFLFNIIFIYYWK